jgi:predicted permease
MDSFPKYVDTFQTILVQFLFAGMGYLFATFGYFASAEAVGFLQITRLVCLPGLVYSELSIAPLSWTMFRPLIHSLLTQLTIHGLSVVAAYLIPTADHFVQFLTFVYSYSHTCFIPYGYPVVRTIFGTEFLYIPVVVNIVQTLLLRPLHTWASFRISLIASTHEFVPEVLHVPRLNIARNGSEAVEPAVAIEPHEAGPGIEEIAVVIEPQEVITDEVELGDDDRTIEDDRHHPRHFKKNMIVAIVSSANVAIICGIIWNLTGVTWPLVLKTVTGNLGKAFCSCTMFSIGVIAQSHPFSIGYWRHVISFLSVHHLVNPLIAIAWAFALRMETLSARACVLLWAMPIEWTGAWLVDKRGSPRNPITATAFWSQLLAVPLFFCWLAVVGETGLFG